MARRVLVSAGIMLVMLAIGAPAFACGGLVGPNGAVNLLKTTTFAGYHNGQEHYVTSFSFAGADSGTFGSLVPLPGIPSKVERGGQWTLQRLIQETAPPTLRFAASADSEGLRARVILKTKIDALDITVLEGGAREIGVWAEDNGFVLPPDAPEVLEFYAKRSPVFMAAQFDAAAAVARGQRAGDGTPIHLTIPTQNPWVPVRILGLGKQAIEPVEADIYLLTDRKPALLPAPVGTDGSGVTTSALTLARSEVASQSLLEDLRSDKGMGWIPRSGMYLSYLQLSGPAAQVTFDLAIDASGAETPSPVAAGLVDAFANSARDAAPAWNNAIIAAIAALIAVSVALGRRVTSDRSAR